jgi:hypothetical protein
MTGARPIIIEPAPPEPCAFAELQRCFEAIAESLRAQRGRLGQSPLPAGQPGPPTP